MRSHLLVVAAAALLYLPLAASADVSYSYTGKLFNDVYAQIAWEGEPPEVSAQRSADATAALLADRITIGFTSPVYIPQGWSTFGSTFQGYGGALLAPLQALADNGVKDPGITWHVNSSLFSGNGHIALAFDPAAYDWLWASAISVAVHVGADQQIDAWSLSMSPGMAVGETAVTWQQQLSSSSDQGDRILLDTIGRRYVATEYGVSATPGTWAVNGSPVSLVPEPVAAAMLLAGLATLVALRRRNAQ